MANATQEQEQATEQATETTYPNHTGGGWYELADGSKVQGKDAAAAAQAKLDGDTGPRSRACHQLHDLELVGNQDAAKADAAKAMDLKTDAITAGIWGFTIAQPNDVEVQGFAIKTAAGWQARVELDDVGTVERKAKNFKSIVSALRDLARDQAPGGIGVKPTLKKVYDNKTSGATHQVPAPVQKARKARSQKQDAKAS